MTILIQNGQVINPATGMNEVADVLVENGVVSKIEKGSKKFNSLPKSYWKIQTGY